MNVLLPLTPKIPHSLVLFFFIKILLLHFPTYRIILGIWHPGKGKKTVLVWDPDEEVEYETGSDWSSEEEEDEEVCSLIFYQSREDVVLKQKQKQNQKQNQKQKKIGSCVRIR